MDEQYQAITSGVGFARLEDQTLIEVRGEDRAAFLHNLCTNDIRGLKPGSGCEAFFTNVQGKILAFANVFCGPQSIVLETVPGQAEALLAQLDRYLIREDVQLLDRTSEWSQTVVAGSQTPDTLASVTSEDPAGAPWNGGLWSHAVARVADHEVAICRVPLLGSECWVLRGEQQAVSAADAALESAGAVACDAQTVEMVRMECGTPLYGRDISDANLPQEVDRDETAISFVKGCYLGQETVARIDALGHVNKVLRGVRLAGDEVPAPGTALTQDGSDVGHVTSSIFSSRLSAPLAIAYVRRGHQDVGTRLESPVGAAEVVALPLSP